MAPYRMGQKPFDTHCVTCCLECQTWLSCHSAEVLHFLHIRLQTLGFMTFCTTFEKPVPWACIHMTQHIVHCRSCIGAGGLSNDNQKENIPSHSQYSTLLWHLFPLPLPPPFPIPLSTWPANFTLFSSCPKHLTHSATTPSPHKHTVTERDCHLNANFLSLSYHLLCCNTGGSTAMWTISTSTNTHWAAITHSRCRNQASPKNQAYTLHLHESHCRGITRAL